MYTPVWVGLEWPRCDIMQISVVSCILDFTTRDTHIIWEKLISKKQQKRRTWESWFTSLWKSPNNVLQQLQCKKGNQALGMIKRNFAFRSREVIIKLYKSLVRPHLDYAMQAWSPYMEKDKKIIEKVQARATKLIPNLKYLPYEDRLNRLNLTTLERRQRRGSYPDISHHEPNRQD